MLDIQILTTRETNPRWRMDIQRYNEITYDEQRIIDSIAMTLEQINAELDQEKENEDLPFN